MALDSVLLRALRGVKVGSRQAPMLQQAVGEAVARYAPEYDQLAQLREQSAHTMRQTRSQATSAAQLISALANQTNHNIQADTNPVIQRVAAYEGAPGSSGLVGKGLAYGQRGITEILGQASLNAPIAAQQQIAKAQATHLEDLDKINSQRTSLYGQAGNFITGRLSDLASEDRKLRADVSAQKRTIKTQLATAGLDPVTGKYDPSRNAPPKPKSASEKKAEADLAFFEKHGYYPPTGPPSGPQLPGGVKPATPQQHGALKDKIGAAVSQIERMDASIRKAHPEMSRTQRRHRIAQTLLQGREAQTVDDNGTKLKVPGVPKFGPLSASVALDRYYDTHVSNRNAAELHRRGYSVKALGLPGRSKSTPAKRVNRVS